MRKTILLGEAAGVVNELSRDCRDELVPVRSVSFRDAGSICIGEKEYPLTPVARYLMARRLGVPLSYLDRCPAGLQAQNLNHWIREEKNESFFVRFSGDRVRALFTPRYMPVDNVDIVRKLYEMGYDDSTELQCTIDPNFMALSIPTKSGAFDVKGDEFLPGFSIQNSEVGLHSLSLTAFCLRLVCSNGMISEDAYSQSYRHVSPDLADRLPQVIEDVSERMQRQRKELLLSRSRKVTDPFKTLDRLNTDFRLSPIERGAVEWAWLLEEGDTMFSIINTYTRAAQVDWLNAMQSVNLQRIGGVLLSMTR